MSTAGYSRKVYAKSSGTAPSSGDLVGACTDSSFPESVNMLSTNAFGSDGNNTRLPGLYDANPSASGDCDFADSPQNLIRSSFRGRTLIYITHLANGTNGYTFPCYVESYEEQGAPDDKATWSASFQLSGAPIVVP